MQRETSDAELRTYLQMLHSQRRPQTQSAHGGVDMNLKCMHPLSKSHKKYKDKNDAECSVKKTYYKKV